MSIVMSDDSYSVKFPINEPAAGKRKSQIEEYLDAYGGPGVQHVALQVKDVLFTVDQPCSRTGSSFCACPTSTTTFCATEWERSTNPWKRSSAWAFWWTAMKKATCCKSSRSPVEDRPTLFFEIIQRKGSRGFGKGNFKALFEAIELEQERRGNL
jgi:4-hydroxyphenylpyruvate dioxygenase